MQRKIIIGYDGREGSDDAVALGTRLAELTGSTLILAYAYGDEVVSGTVVGDANATSLDAAAERVLRQGLRQVPYGFAVATRAIPDSPAATVLRQLAERERAVLIVIGSSDFGLLSRVLIGTVGERLLRGAPCAVAVAPAGFRDRGTGPLKRIGVCWDGSGAGARGARHGGGAGAGGRRRAAPLHRDPADAVRPASVPERARAGRDADPRGGRARPQRGVSWDP